MDPLSSKKVRLQSYVNPNEYVVLDVTPSISETQITNFQQYQPVHTPGATQVFTSAGSRFFSIQPIVLISRTGYEASRNLCALRLLRSWSKNQFGTSTAIGSLTESGDPAPLLGSPPPVLLLSAYSDNQHGLINKVPVVMSNLGITFPNDCDYIPTAEVNPTEFAGRRDVGPAQSSSTDSQNIEYRTTNIRQKVAANIPFPTVMQIDVTLLETHSPLEYQRFNLSDYKAGNLVNF